MSIRQKYPNFYQPHPSAMLEHVVLSNSNKFWKEPVVQRRNRQAAEGNKSPAAESDKESHSSNDESDSKCFKKRSWMHSQNSEAIVFCNESSMHGLKFMVQPKIHFTERVFWIVAFLLSFSAAVYLIHEVWDRQSKLPVIISFHAKEQHINSIPFPAVTICSMNRFPKSKVLQLEREAEDPENPNNLIAKKRLSYVRAVCNSEYSFAKRFRFAHGRGTKYGDGEYDTLANEEQNEMIEYLLENTLDCGEFIRLCALNELIWNCSDLFKPIITDSGKCCSFNIMPFPLLFQNQSENGTVFANYFSDATGNWDNSELDYWRQWDYNKGYAVPKLNFRPYRQSRAGMPHGLSILIDPNIDDVYCPVSDSMGIRYILHSPLEMPHVLELASVAGLGREVMVTVHPDVTIADADIEDIEQKKRQCWFGKERENWLRRYRPYTAGNCIDYCNAEIILSDCQCRYFYMPGLEGERICNTDMNSTDYECVSAVLATMQVRSQEVCDSCNPLCDSIEYNYESTSAELQDGTSLWGDPDPQYHPNGVPEWANHKMTILHIFFGSDTTTPKLRKRLYGITDLIANTGGILGLCLGFSVLSGVEVIYFLILRAFWKYCRKRMGKKRTGMKTGQEGILNKAKIICVQSND